MDNIKELCKRVLQSNLSDDDKIEIITKLNKDLPVTINTPLYRSTEPFLGKPITGTARDSYEMPTTIRC